MRLWPHRRPPAAALPDALPLQIDTSGGRRSVAPDRPSQVTAIADSVRQLSHPRRTVPLTPCSKVFLGRRLERPRPVRLPCDRGCADAALAGDREAQQKGRTRRPERRPAALSLLPLGSSMEPCATTVCSACPSRIAIPSQSVRSVSAIQSGAADSKALPKWENPKPGNRFFPSRTRYDQRYGSASAGAVGAKFSTSSLARDPGRARFGTGKAEPARTMPCPRRSIPDLVIAHSSSTRRSS